MTTVGLSVTTAGDMSTLWVMCHYRRRDVATAVSVGDETNIGKKDVLHHISSFMVCDVIKKPIPMGTKVHDYRFIPLRKVSITN